MDEQDDIVQTRSSRGSSAAALVTEDGDCWSFGRLDDEVSRLARAWGRAIVERDAILIYAPNSVEFLLSLCAAWRLGAIPVLLNHRYDAREVERVIGRVRPTAVVWSRDARSRPEDCIATKLVETTLVDGSLPGVRLLCAATTSPAVPRQEWLGHQAAESDEECSDRDVLAVLLTGGTTGAPKEVIVSKRGTLRLIEAQRAGQTGRAGTGAARARHGEPDRFNLVATPLFHLIGLKSLLFAWTHDRAVVLMRKFEARRYAELVGRHKVDNLFLLPTMVYDLVECDVSDECFAHVKYAVVGGQSLAEDLRRRFVDRFGVPILTHYGSTEVGAVAGWNLADLRDGHWRPDSVGRIYPGVEVSILDHGGRALPLGETGEIAVRSDASAGYIDGESAEPIRDQAGWTHTGDVGRLDELGRLFIAGRQKELIKVGGFQVWPAEVEETLRTQPLVRDVAVIGVDDKRLGEVPIAVVVPTVPLGDLPDDAETSLIDACKQHLARYKAPHRVVFVAEIPRNDAGKVTREPLIALADSAD